MIKTLQYIYQTYQLNFEIEDCGKEFNMLLSFSSDFYEDMSNKNNNLYLT